MRHDFRELLEEWSVLTESGDHHFGLKNERISIDKPHCRRCHHSISRDPKAIGTFIKQIPIFCTSNLIGISSCIRTAIRTSQCNHKDFTMPAWAWDKVILFPLTNIYLKTGHWFPHLKLHLCLGSLNSPSFHLLGGIICDLFFVSLPILLQFCYRNQLPFSCFRNGLEFSF